MTKVVITIEADMRIAALACEHYERIAETVERELQEIDSKQPTLGRSEPAAVTHCFVRTEHGKLLGVAGRALALTGKEQS